MPELVKIAILSFAVVNSVAFVVLQLTVGRLKRKLRRCSEATAAHFQGELAEEFHYVKRRLDIIRSNVLPLSRD